jgi:hypothetical protein
MIVWPDQYRLILTKLVAQYPDLIEELNNPGLTTSPE